MELGIAGKTALVVGASKNIGRATAELLAAEGCKVITASRSEGIDLMPDGSPDAFCQSIAHTPPDIIVHCIGGSNGVTQTWGSAKDYAAVWRLNLGVAHEINSAFVQRMIDNGWGRIVHISSVTVAEHIGYCPYASAKHAVEGYVKNVSKELSPHGVIMSCVRPGAFPYPGRYLAELPLDKKQEWIMRNIPQGRYGIATECARVIAFMCSDAASYMAGSIVAVDGGHR